MWNSALIRPIIFMFPLARLRLTPINFLKIIAALMDAVNKARPSGAKGNFVKRITIASTMGPGVKADPNEHIEGAE